jgi:predicted enzyme related to lactoylglutathione lyase
MQRRTLAAVFGAGFAVILAVACASGSKSVVPAAVPTASSPLTGKFVWHDLITEDPEACRRFYGALLGWEFEDTHRADKPYIVARAGGHYVAGIVAVPPDATQDLSQWLAYMSVPDVDAAAAKVAAAGGRSLVAPRQVGSIGRAAVVVDPQGAPVGLLRRAGGDPAGALPHRRPLLLDGVPAKDGGRSGLYKALAGYESQARETPADPTRSSPGDARGQDS